PPSPPPPVVPPTLAPSPTSTPQPTPIPPTTTAAIATGPLPTDRVEPLNQPNSDYFPETGHNIKNRFRTFWLENGGLGQFGYPLTEAYDENGIAMQYFERARFEFRNDTVVLALLGSELTQGLKGQIFLG